jgi:hypothetical protein
MYALRYCKKRNMFSRRYSAPFIRIKKRNDSKSWIVQDFGKLLESIDKYQPSYAKYFLIIEKTPL